MVTYTLPIGHPSVRARVFGGPTVARVRQSLIRAVELDLMIAPVQSDLPPAPIEITGAGIRRTYKEDVTGVAGGYHVGGDLAYFFGRFIGLGAGLRFTEVKVDDVPIPISLRISGDTLAGFDAGHFAVSAGLRLRF